MTLLPYSAGMQSWVETSASPPLEPALPESGTPPASPAPSARSCWWISSTSTRTANSTAVDTMQRPQSRAALPAMR